MASGTLGAPLAQGGMRVGPLVVPESLTRELLAQDLITSTSASRITITEDGAAYLRRAEAAAQPKPSPALWQRQHQLHVVQRVEGPRSTQRAEVNLAESPLGWLYSRRGADGARLLEAGHLTAAARLRSDFDAAGLSPRITAAYDGLPVSRKRSVSPSMPLPLRAIAARQRYQNAVDAMGPGLGDIVVRTCCYLEGMEHAERDLKWPARSGKVILRLGLDRLIAHYDALDYQDGS